MSQPSRLLSLFLQIARWEGTSFLVLLLIAMPLKYIWGQPMAVRITGMLHGVLFIAYVILLAAVAYKESWKLQRIALALLASLLPGGPFVLDARLRATQRA